MGQGLVASGSDLAIVDLNGEFVWELFDFHDIWD
jgi:hypothetical protein